MGVNSFSSSPTCYMCDKSSTSTEHVPPKCFFPDIDETGGVDLRKNLLTVTSCDDHNLRKSDDDVYAWYVVSVCHGAENVGQLTDRSRLWRGIARRPALFRQMLADAKPAIFSDPEKPETYETLALSLNENRFHSEFEKIGRALYFKHFDRKWLGPVRSLAEFLFFPDSTERTVNQSIEIIRSAANKLFKDKTPYGSNPEAFSYYCHAEEKMTIMRLVFYGRARIIVRFGEERPT